MTTTSGYVPRSPREGPITLSWGKRRYAILLRTSSVFIIRPSAQRYGILAKIPVTYMTG